MPWAMYIDSESVRKTQKVNHAMMRQADKDEGRTELLGNRRKNDPSVAKGSWGPVKTSNNWHQLASG